MDLRQLEYVVGVVDHGGFTRAAAALHVTQPSLSQGIARLEAELGVPLFERIGRRAVLSGAGEAVVAPARRALRDARAVREAIAALRGLEIGTLDVVALPTLAADPLARLVGAFRRAHPGITVRVMEPEGPDAVARLVRDGDCDVGITELPVGADDLVAEPLLEDELLVVAPPGTRRRPGPLRARDLAAEPIVATPPGTSTRRVVDRAFEGAGVEPLIAVETRQREAIVPLVLAGAGTSFLPQHSAAAARDAGAVVSRLDPPLVRTIGTVRRRGPVPPAAGAFLELARAERS